MDIKKYFLMITLLILFMGVGSGYNVTVNVSLYEENGIIKNDFYGYLGGNYAFGNSTTNSISNLSSKVINNPSNHTWHREQFANSGSSMVLLNSVLRNKYSNSSNENVNLTDINGTADFTNATEWFYLNGYKVTILIDTMPQWLALNDSSLCISTLYTCPPNNYTKWNKIVVDFLNRTTQNGRYNISVVIWNEANAPTSWLNNISTTTNITRYEYYAMLYNSTYDAIKTAYPGFSIGGPNVNNLDSADGRMFMYSFLGNFSAKTDFFAYHTYWDETKGDEYNYYTTMNRQIYGNISLYNIGDARNTEWKVKNGTSQNDSTYWNTWRNQLSLTYASYLNYKAGVYSLVNYLWSDQYLEQNNSNLPYVQTAVSEPRLNGTWYPPYNITRIYGKYHKSSNIIFNFTSSNSSLKIVASKDTSKYYFTLTNTENEKANVTLNTSLSNYNAYLRDVETGLVYTKTSNGLVNISNLAEYGVMTLESMPAVQINYNNNILNGSISLTKYVTLDYNITTLDGLKSLNISIDGNKTDLFDKMLVWFQFNNLSSLGENSTLVVNLAPNAHVNGSINNTLDWSVSAGKNSGGFKFYENQTADNPRFIAYTRETNNYTAVSWSVWIKPNNFKNNRVSIANLIGAYDVWLSWTNATASCYISGHNQSANSDWESYTGFNLLFYTMFTRTNVNTCPINNWSHFAGTVVPNGDDNGYNFTIYINGIKQSIGTSKSGTFPAHSSIETWIGSHVGYPQYEYLSLNGSLDDFMVWNRSLSDVEFETLYYLQIQKYNNQNFTINVSGNFQNVINHSINIKSEDNSGNIDNNLITFYKNYVTKLNSLKTQIGSVNNWFYGANTHSSYGIGLASDATDASWRTDKWLKSKMTYQRVDMGLNSYFDAFYNWDFEHWKNISAVVGSNGSLEMPFGWRIASYNDGISTAYQTTDSKSGTYALALNCSNYVLVGSVCPITNYNPSYIKLTPGNMYNFSIWVKGQGNEALWLQYNGVTRGLISFTLSNTWTMYSLNFTPNSSETSELWTFKIDLNAGNNITIDSVNVTENGTEWNGYWLDSTTTRNNWIALLNFSKYYNQKIMFITSYMPKNVANLSSQLCNRSTSYYSVRCPADNYDKLGRMNKDFIDSVNVNGTYNDTIEIEVWNEPDIGFFLDNVTNYRQEHADEYIKLYNATYYYSKLYYPDIDVGGPALAGTSYPNNPNLVSNMSNTFLSNFSDRMDYYSVHSYIDYIYTTVRNNTESFKGLCSSYNSNCSRFIWSEWNVGSAYVKNTTSLYNQYEKDITLTYTKMLNYIPSNATMIMYQFNVGQKYNTSYDEYPSKWHMVSGPTYDNELTRSYNATYKMTRQHSGGDVIITSISDNSDVDVVVSNGSKCSVTIVNNDLAIQNITLNLTAVTGCNKGLVDIDDGTLYSSDTEANYIGTLVGYEVKYLTTPNITLIQGVGINKTNSFGEQIGSISNEINVSSITTSDTGKTYHIASSVNTTLDYIMVSAPCSNIQSVLWKPNGATTQTSPTYTCSGGILTVYNVQVNPSTTSNELQVTYSAIANLDDNGFTRAILNLVLGMFALMILGVSLLFLRYYYFNGEELTIGRIVHIAVIIILAIVFISILATIIASS